MIDERCLTIHGREVRLTTHEEFGRFIIKIYDVQENKLIAGGNYDVQVTYDNEITRFLNNVMELLPKSHSL